MKGKGTIIYFWLNAQQSLNRDFHLVRVRLGLASFTWAIAIVCCCLLSLFSQAARGDSVTVFNTGNVTIPDAGGYVSSTITISSTLADLVPQSISVPSPATAGISASLGGGSNAGISKLDSKLSASANSSSQFYVVEHLMTYLSYNELLNQYGNSETPPKKITFLDTDSLATQWFSFHTN